MSFVMLKKLTIYLSLFMYGFENGSVCERSDSFDFKQFEAVT